MRRFSTLYGAGPAHLLLALAAFAIAAYAGFRMLGKGPPVALGKWFLGAIVSHDLILLPLYSLALLVLLRLPGLGGVRDDGSPIPPARLLVLNHLRVPAGLSLLLLLLFFPLVLGLSETGYRSVSGLGTDPFLERWLLLSAALFAVSGAVLVLRLVRDRRRSPGERREAPRGAK